MKTTGLAVFLMLCLLMACKQEVFQFVEEPPVYPGGELALKKFLDDSISYPKTERDKMIAGNAMVRFVIEPDGSISNIVVTKPLTPLLDAEAVRVIKMLPKFKPGRQHGKAVRVYCNVPITFKL